MDTYLNVFVIVIFALMMEVNLVNGFPVKRDNASVKHSDGNLNTTCVTKHGMVNESMNSVGTALRPDNTSTFLNESLFELKRSNITVRKAEKDENKNSLQPRKRELPMAMIIAGPAAAVGIALFLCILYFWHAHQLNSKARELSVSLYVSPDESTDSNDSTKLPLNAAIPRSPRSSIPPVQGPAVPSFAQRRKSTLSVPSLGIPGNMHKRGSSWSAIADQEIINLSAPRRHSTFIL